METIIKFSLTGKEIQKMIPFAPLAECENKLKTGKAKRLMAQLGILPETLEHYQDIARRWYLITGCPDGTEFTAQELSDWSRIGELISNL